MILESRRQFNFTITEWVFHISMGIAILFGIFLRLKGLGTWPFGSSDEYYFAKSVQNILQKGIPQFEFGGFYSRGLLLQYLSALLLMIGLRDEFALRLIPVIFNLLCIPAIYQLGKKISGTIVGCVAVIVFVLSVWEIEFARFARMYVPFQTVFIWYVYFLYRVIVENDRKSTKWMYILSVVGVFIYKGSIFLALLNFLPFILNQGWKEWKNYSSTLMVSIMIFLFSYGFNSLDFRFLGAERFIPDDISEPVYQHSRIDYPHLFAKFLPSSTVFLVTYVILLLLSGFAVYFILREKNLSFFTKVSYTVIILFSSLNLFGLSLLLLASFYLLNWFKLKDAMNKYFGLLISIGVLYLIFWIIFGFSTSEWHIMFEEFDPSEKLKKLLIVLIDYPFIYDKIVDKYVSAMPLFTVFSVLFLGYSLLDTLRKTPEGVMGFRFLMFIIIFHALLVGVLVTPYKNARYTFFLFPMVILLVVYSIHAFSSLLKFKPLISQGIFVSLIGLFLFVSEDFNFNHIINIDSKEVNYRMNYGVDSEIAKVYIRRYDVRTPAEVINKNASKEDIIIATLLTVDYYLDRIDYVYKDYRKRGFTNMAISDGTSDLWTNSKLLYKEEDMLEIIKNPGKTVWICAYSEKSKNPWPIESILAEEFENSLYYTSIDETINVYRIHSTVSTSTQ